MGEEVTVHGSTVEVHQDPPATRRTLRQEVDDLRAEGIRQAEHIDALHRIIDQLVERMDELGYEVGWAPGWHPVIDRPTAVPLADVRNPRRADRYQLDAAAVTSEANQRLAGASEDRS